MDTHIFAGTVQSGGTGSITPLTGVPVTLYEATADEPVRLGGATTDANGRFTFHNTNASTDFIFYATAQVSSSVVLITVVGPSIDGEIVINELTTVAALFSMAQFARGTVISGAGFRLRIAAGMCANLALAKTGESSPVLLAPPNGDQTNSLRSTRALANLVAGCVRPEPGYTGKFFGLATPPGGSTPQNTAQALLNIARNPANNAGALYDLSLPQALQAYTPALQSPPDAWTLAVKVNDSGNDDFMFGGPANVVFDHDGYAWVSNNVVQGESVSATCIMVLRPDGRPARGEDGKPASPVFGGGILGPGFGIDIDRRTRHVWVGNYGWGKVLPNGSVTELKEDGTAVSDSDGYQGGTQYVQATVVDRSGNVWLASLGNDSVIVFPGGDSTTPIPFQEPAGSAPFGVAITEEGRAWVTNCAGLMPGGVSSVCRYRLDGTELVREKTTTFGSAVKGIALDSGQNVWCASGGEPKDANGNVGPGRVYLLTPEGDVVDGFMGGGIDTPWGVAVDGDDNVWVANFGRMHLGAVYTTGALSKLKGANPNTEPTGMATGTPISPGTGYTLPSAGAPVTLHDGSPLYKDGTECLNPLMRSTSCIIDQAGNVWVVNNWKPRFDTDFESKVGNPGGDGIVIFVGLATPPVPPPPAQSS